MTVPVQETINRSTGNGVTTVFPYSFFLPTANDLIVTVNDIVVTTGFTVSGIGVHSGGNVTFTTAPANGVNVILERIIKLERTTDYQQNGDFLSSVVNSDFDRIWMAHQQHRSAIDRAIKIPIGDTPIDVTLPATTSRADKLLGFDSAGKPIAVAPVAGTAAALSVALAASSGAMLVGTKYTNGLAINLQKWIDGGRVSAGAQSEGIFSSLQDAIDEANTRSKGLTVSGLWIAAARLNLYANISIEGHRSGDTIIKLADGVDDHLLYGSGLTSVRIAGVTLDGNKANQTSGAVARCLYLVDSKQVYAERLIVKNAADHGMHISTGPTTDPMSDSSEVWIDKCIFADNGTDFTTGNGGSGIAWTGRRLWARDSYAYGNLLAGFKFTGQYVAASGLHAHANLAGGFTTGFDVVSEEGLRHAYTACRATSNGNPAGNTMGGDGFRHQGQVDRIIHRDCVASDNQWSGVALVASLSVNPVDFDIFGGEYKNNGTSFVPSNIVSGSGIALLSTNSGSVPTNVRIENVTATDTQATKTQLYGVEIQQGGNVTIGAGCRLAGNKTGSVFNAATTVAEVHMQPSIESADFIVRSRASASVTGTTAATDLYTITIPANTFSPGQRFRIRSRGSVSGANSTKQIRLWVGAGAALVISQSAAEVQEWIIDGCLEVAGSASTKTAVTGVEIGGSTTSLIISDPTALSAAITIKIAVTLGSAADVVTGASFYVEPIY